ncbi:hypothetical protein GCM10027405_39310 [Arthrobacter alkaliphilus]
MKVISKPQFQTAIKVLLLASPSDEQPPGLLGPTPNSDPGPSRTRLGPSYAPFDCCPLSICYEFDSALLAIVGEG